MMVGMATVILLMLAGVVLLFLETLLPGLIAGVTGFLCLAAGVIVTYRDFGAEAGHLVLLGVMVILIVGVVLWLRYFPQSRMGRIFVSDSVVGEMDLALDELIHKEGVARSPLRPSGTAIIEGKRYDVVSEGGFIPAETSIQVVSVEGSRVVVRAKD